MLLSACAAPKPEYSESEKVFREMDLSRISYVLGKISVKPKEAANNQKFVRKGYMDEDKIKHLLGEEMEKQLSLLDGDPRRNGSESGWTSSWSTSGTTIFPSETISRTLSTPIR
jgi:hypothetical protein